MMTVIEPQRHLSALWSKPAINEDEEFRLMRYVLRVDCEDKVLLHNVVTGQLVVLDREEAELLSALPGRYSPNMRQLIDDHYLVPNEFDEHQYVVKLREVLRKLEEGRHTPIIQYKILPTTACNARCYYCFEQGIKTTTMSEQTANDVIDFIVKNSENKEINITWFGGEPTAATDRIDQISRGLQENQVKYRSDMISNGYLFDEEMADRAKKLWKLTSIQISVDGTEKNYNRIKAYRNASSSPYQRVLRNVGLLLDKGISVGLRMNFDVGNYLDFKELIEEAANRFHRSKFLQVYAYPVIGEYADSDGKILHGSDSWLAEKCIELNDFARKAGLYRKKKDIPFLSFIGCEPDRNDAVVINPEGKLCRCGEQIENEQAVGTVTEGITDYELLRAWKQLGDYPACADCVFFPRCMKMAKCAAKEHCYVQDRNAQYIEAIRDRYLAWKISTI